MQVAGVYLFIVYTYTKEGMFPFSLFLFFSAAEFVFSLLPVDDGGRHANIESGQLDATS